MFECETTDVSVLDLGQTLTLRFYSAPLVLGCETTDVSVLDLGQTLLMFFLFCGGSLKVLRNFGGGSHGREKEFILPASVPYSLHS